jgi:hypothetical protein
LASEYKATTTRVKAEIEQAKAIGQWRDAIDFQWSGWLYPLEGTWRVGGRTEIADQEELYVLVIARGGEPPAFQLVGKHSKGLLVDPQADGPLKPGRPVFVRTKRR